MQRVRVGASWATLVVRDRGLWLAHPGSHTAGMQDNATATSSLITGWECACGRCVKREKPCIANAKRCAFACGVNETANVVGRPPTQCSAPGWQQVEIQHFPTTCKRKQPQHEGVEQAPHSVAQTRSKPCQQRGDDARFQQAAAHAPALRMHHRSKALVCAHRARRQGIGQPHISPE